jgi:hypothetical protein
MELLHTQEIGAVEAVSLPKNVWTLGQLRHHHYGCPRHDWLSAGGARLRNVTDWLRRLLGVKKSSASRSLLALKRSIGFCFPERSLLSQ